MLVSIFDIFKIGIGPSSSHTIGPMRAAYSFLTNLENKKIFEKTERVQTDLYGSLALTGQGHGTLDAVILGLMGQMPETVNCDLVPLLIDDVKREHHILLNDKKKISYNHQDDICLHKNETLPLHSNGLKFSAFDENNNLIFSDVYYSIGGGFVTTERDYNKGKNIVPATPGPYNFASSAELLTLGHKSKLSIADMMMQNEITEMPKEEVKEKILYIRDVMNNCIDRGCSKEGVLPGGLNVKRRAKELYTNLQKRFEKNQYDPLDIMDWVNLWAIAVNEENASGGQVVTAPTNGAAGIIPAVLRYYERYCPTSNEKGIIDFFMAATAIANLYKNNASISGAEVGCQGEVGVACSMAAAGLVAAIGGTNEQIENAAEIGIEHNLGLTCDPVAGLVQVPCIERNAMGAIKAINAARLSLKGDGTHMVSLDKAIETMRQTGLDMQEKYKETSKGGLAVNVISC
ncbi:MAG: L-serine ammonia-lyase [Alphaproteobacteria bacterium]